MKKTVCAAVADVTLSLASAARAQEATPTMSPGIVSQDAMASGAMWQEPVPILMLIFLVLTMIGGNGVSVTPH